MRIIEAQAKISAKDATGSVFAAIAGKLERLASKAQSAGRRAAAANSRAETAERVMGARRAAGGALRNAAGAAAGMSGVGGLGAAGALYTGVQAVKRYASTDLALTRIGITAEATDAQIVGLNKTIRDLAFQTGKPFDEVASGLDSLVAGGMELDRSLAGLPAIVKTAQASGSEISDISNSALAMSQSLEIPMDKMQSAFDILVAGGKAGKFELKDMSRYMASFGPVAAAAGYKGEEGLRKMVAMLQTIRQGSGSSEEAASSFTDILGKMETDETANKFKKFGIDIRKEMDITRKAGGDLIERFVELSKQAVKGDLSKLPLLAGDKEMRRGLLALATYGDKTQEVLAALRKAAGASDVDLERVLSRPQIAVDRLAESFDRAKTALGAYLDKLGASRALKWMAEDLEDTSENGPKFPWQLGPDRDRDRERTEAELQTARQQLAQDEKQAGKPESGRNAFVKESARGGTSPAIAEQRRRIFDLEQSLAVQRAAPGPGEMFSPKEIQAWKDAEDRRKGDEDFLAIGRNKRVGATGSMGWKGGHRPDGIPGAAGENNTLDLPYQGGGEPDRRAAMAAPPMDVKAELTGSADVKGETTVKVEVTVNPSSALLESIASAKAASAKMEGVLKAGNGPGSTGKASPDTGASGGW